MAVAKLRAAKMAAGGTVAKPKAVGDRQANKREVMTCMARERSIPTADQSDRAHDVRDEADGGLLMPSGKVPNARPRRYPKCYMVGPVGAPVSFESAADDLYERQRWLASEGLCPIPKTVGVAVAERLHEATGGDSLRLRDILKGKSGGRRAKFHADRRNP